MARLETEAPPNALYIYLHEQKRPLLTHDEEIALAKCIEYGREAHQLLEDGQDTPALLDAVHDAEEARIQFVEANRTLVVSVAKRYRGCGMQFCDIIQEGNIGLIRAVDTFDYRLGNKFSTYATECIREAVIASLIKTRDVRLSHDDDRLLRKIFRTQGALVQKLGEERPTPEEIARALDVPSREVRRLLSVIRRPISLQEPVNDESESELGDFISESEPVDCDREVDRDILKQRVGECLGDLTERQAYIVTKRFGLDGQPPVPPWEIAEKLKVTTGRLRQITAEAIRRLRHSPKGAKLAAYYLD